jgi:O-antigen ligase
MVPWLLSLACTAVCLVIAPWSAHARLTATVASAWLAAAVISALFGLLQYFGVASELAPWVNNPGVGEAFANLRQRNQFATLTNMGLAALLWWSAQLCSENPHQPTGTVSPRYGIAIQASFVVGAAMLAVGNAASSSRTGLVQLALLVVLTWLWGGLRRPDVRRLLWVAVLAYGAGSAALPWFAGLDVSSTGILARLHDGGPACSSRLTLWRNVLYLISLRPWLGWGWGELDYAHFTTLYAGPRFCEILDNAHNLPLHLAVELGVPMAVLICGLGTWLVWRADPWHERDATRQMAWSVLALIMLHSLLEYPLWYGPFQMAFGLCIVLLWPVHTYTRPNGDFQKNRVLAPVLRLVIAIVLGVIAVYAAWDYHRISQIFLASEARSSAYRVDTLQKVQGTWLFQNQVRFAEFVTTPLTRDNAAHLNALAHQLLHYSPEARVAEKLIESAVMLGRDDEALFYLVRYRAAFPAEHAKWSGAQAGR